MAVRVLLIALDVRGVDARRASSVSQGRRGSVRIVELGRPVRVLRSGVTIVKIILNVFLASSWRTGFATCLFSKTCESGFQRWSLRLSEVLTCPK